MEGIKTAIVRELGNVRAYRKTLSHLEEIDNDPDIIRQALELEDKLGAIHEWLLILTPQEAFVIRRHLVDGGSWAQVAHEYVMMFGGVLAGQEAMERYQEQALNRIAQLIQEEPHAYEFLFKLQIKENCLWRKWSDKP